MTVWDAVRIAYYCGLNFKLTAGRNRQIGRMFAVPSSHEHAGSLCNEPKYQRRIAVAAYNSPSLVILPRNEDAIDEVKTQLGQKEVFA